MNTYRRLYPKQYILRVFLEKKQIANEFWNNRSTFLNREGNERFDRPLREAEEDIHSLNGFRALNVGFEWEKTQEGFEFWSELNREFQRLLSTLEGKGIIGGQNDRS